MTIAPVTTAPRSSSSATQQFSEWKTLLLAGGIGLAVYTAYAIMWVVAIDSFW